MTFPTACPDMLLHSYTEPQWLLEPTSHTSSLDRLEETEAALWDEQRKKILPDITTKPIGTSDSFPKAGNGAKPPGPAVTLSSWVHKYAARMVPAGREEEEEKERKQQTQSFERLPTPSSDKAAGSFFSGSGHKRKNDSGFSFHRR